MNRRWTADRVVRPGMRRCGYKMRGAVGDPAGSDPVHDSGESGPGVVRVESEKMRTCVLDPSSVVVQVHHHIMTLSRQYGVPRGQLVHVIQEVQNVATLELPKGGGRLHSRT